MTSEGLGEMFEGDSVDTCTEKCPLVLMGVRVEGLAYARPPSEFLGSQRLIPVLLGPSYTPKSHYRQLSLVSYFSQVSQCFTNPQ
jgi:hypothetical protein